MRDRADLLDRRSRRFLLLFAGSAALLALVFFLGQDLLARIYLFPISWTAAWLLQQLGIAARLDATFLSQGFCLLILERLTLRVIHECSGIFAFFLFLAALFAYPARIQQKLWGLGWGLAAFLLYGSLRLIALGLIAHFHPAWIPFFHLYLMVLLNLGFLLFVWVSWVNGVHRRE